MRIKILRTFTDLTASNADDAEVLEGKEITVTAERGAELIDIGLAEEVTASKPDAGSASNA